VAFLELEVMEVATEAPHMVTFFCIIIYVVDLWYFIQKESGCFIPFIGTFYQNILVEAARFFNIN
jgi:hypothetical protein